MLLNKEYREPVKVRDYTPKVLTDLGVPNLPMYENPAHIRRNILTEIEAGIYGLRIGSRINYHGLGIDSYMKVIDSLDDPRAIFKNTKRNDYLIITTQKDKYGNTVIVPIEIETTCNSNKNIIKINRVKTVFGFDGKYCNKKLHEYIKHYMNINLYKKVYKKRTRCRE